MTTRDPFESYLKKAAVLFEVGDVVQAGQIWQAILKKAPNHAEARAGLYKVKLYFDARATQDGLISEAKQEPVAQPEPHPAPPPEVAVPNELVRMLEQGCTLYDAGHFEDAIAKWALVLERDPSNVLAKGYITGAQRALGQPTPETPKQPSPRSTAALAPELYLGTGAIPAPAPSAPKEALAPNKDEVDRLLRDGCTLYDMGQPEDALRKWEQLLGIEPEHQLARAYIKDARRDLGLDTLSDGAIPVPQELPPTGVHPGEQAARIEQLMREGTQLFDMGMSAEAILKWEEVLALEPHHPDAEAYRALALKESQPPSVPIEKPAVEPLWEEIETHLRKAESLLHQGRFEESAFLFQEALKLAPQNVRALQGLHQAETLQEARRGTHAAPSAQLYPPTPPLPGAQRDAAITPPLPLEPPLPETDPAEPPSLLTAPAPPPRKGLELPRLLRQLEAEIPPWLKEPKIIGAILGSVVALNVIYLVIRWNRGETLLKQKTISFRETALASVARNLDITNLGESPEAIRREAESALSDDPLRAYYRAQALIVQNPLDAPAAQLMGQASAAMAQSPAGGQGSIQEVDKLLQGGELDGAERMLLGLLKKTPDDADLKARLARLSLNLTQIYALKERWGDAEDQLKRGRAMFPADKAWGARLVFLGRIKAMSAEERRAWIQFLG